jgi:tripartite ATP-independent transporter DctP family solute receptor
VISVTILGLFLPQAGAQKKVIIRLSSSYEPGSMEARVAEHFKSSIEKTSKGEITVQLFLGASMGSEEEITESVKIGGVEAQVGGGVPIKMYAPSYTFLEGLYVFRDWEHFQKVWQSPLGDKLRKLFEEKGNMAHLGIYYRGRRQTMSGKKPFYHPDDLKGVKLRLPMFPAWVTTWKEIGALPVPVPFSEVFMALQTGVAEACEMDLPSFSGHKLYEVQKYLIMTNHTVQFGQFTIGKKFLSGLSKEHQGLILQSGKEACDFATNYMLERETQFAVDLQKKGMQVIIPDVVAFQRKAKPAVDKLFKTDWSVTTLQEVSSYK